MTLPHNTLYWHCHHEVLCEFVGNPQERIDYIKEAKDDSEVDIRLRLFQPVKGKLPPAVAKAGAAYISARAARDKAEAACIKARAARVKAIKTHREEIEALHAKECLDCPWDGKTIFPEEEK